ncbi:MAG: hypothetical protein N2C14_01275, partial [Planctomycetales bacterium]
PYRGRTFSRLHLRARKPQMAKRPFRFLHASDFHLELPPQGLLEVPEHLRETLRDAAVLAAEKVFDAALAAEVDFVILVGDLLDVRWSGLRGPLFLTEQFERLAERDVLVYWAGGKIDPPEAWPAGFHLPDNVYVFPGGRPTEAIVSRDGSAVASMVGCSRSEKVGVRGGDFACSREDLFSIGVIHGRTAADGLSAHEVDYWALGGDHRRNTLFTKPKLAQYPGSPQGRSPKDDGAHGCWVVRVDAAGRPQPSFVATDVARWYNPRLGIEEDATEEDLRQALARRMQALSDEASGADLLVNWTITGCGDLMRRLRGGDMAAELTAWLREEFGDRRPGAWCNQVVIEPPARFPASAYGEQTILGDFLREVRRRQQDSAAALDLSQLLDDPTDATATTIMHWSSTQRKRVLREAAALGLDLLGGEEVEA